MNTANIKKQVSPGGKRSLFSSIMTIRNDLLLKKVKMYQLATTGYEKQAPAYGLYL